MNVNFGLFPELKTARGKDRKKAMSERALADLALWLDPSAQRGAEQRDLAAMD